ncbi:MAG: DUF4445 domain-containing protein [Anaerolineales bacterium]|nr:DUF4445 domain-containing protein [Anaerolineales bacterium]
MAEHKVTFDTSPEPVFVPTGTLLVEAAKEAGVEVMQPCGGQGRCGRCAVQITEGTARRRSSLRLSEEDIAEGYALACQTVIEGDVSVVVPPQEKIQRRLTTDRTAAEVRVPDGYVPEQAQTIKRYNLTIEPPSMEDQTDDWSRLQRALRQETNLEGIKASLGLLRKIGAVLRESGWQVTAVLETHIWDCPECEARLIDLLPGNTAAEEPLWGAAVDIGTTTVSLWLVNLLTGEVAAQVAEYNGQIARGEDVISRIVYAGKGTGGQELSQLVIGTIDELLERACKRAQADQEKIVKMTITGNSTMIHLLLDIPAVSIRLDPFVTGINLIPSLMAGEIDIKIHPEASVDCLPGVASYVGADITAGVLSSGMDDTEKTTLFMDVGTNGEIVLGSREWLVTCAASAGPAFEGAGVKDGMRATKGAIEEVWVNAEDYEPSYRVIGNVKPQGLCGSALISLIAEMFLTGVLDKAGNVQVELDTPRTRQGEHGGEYVIAWADETAHGEDIVITHVDIDNLLRAKAAIYAGYTILADSVGVPLEMVEQVLIGGSFGKYINVEKAVQIGLLPDMPWENFHFLGNTSVQGSYLALIDYQRRERIRGIASRMTYIELSADNSFYDAFMSALFLPHTDMNRFPTVAKMMESVK